MAEKKATRKTEKVVGVKKRKVSGNCIDRTLFNEYVHQRAYYIWEEMGRPQGEDMGIWLRAEQDIRAQFSVK